MLGLTVGRQCAVASSQGDLEPAVAYNLSEAIVKDVFPFKLCTLRHEKILEGTAQSR